MRKFIAFFIIFLIVGFGFSIGYYMYNSVDFETKAELEDAKVVLENNNTGLIKIDLSNDVIETSSKNEKLTTNEIEKLNEKHDEHYILKELNGVIAIYILNENNEEILEEKTEIATQYLPEEDLNKIKKGIIANGKEELNEILEDYE